VTAASADSFPRNRAVLLAYLAPYFAYVLVLSVPTNLLPRPAAYTLAGVVSLAALSAGWRTYVPVRGATTSVLVGVAAGLAGTALWIVLKAPFYPEAGTAWTPAAFWARTIASSTVVPVFEELLFRGFLLRAVVQWEDARRRAEPDPVGVALDASAVANVPAGRWTPLAVGISTVAFAAGHAPGEWVAACAYGLLMVVLYVTRKDLLGCITAHATTNATLALWVRAYGHWSVW
jgi:membrane protease YdiL (CAAX protease family)